MKIAILGANSEIAKDLTPRLSGDGHDVWAFARKGPGYRYCDYNVFHISNGFDAIINFVGIGDPDKIKIMGGDIFRVTDIYDNMVLNYLKFYHKRKYIFISSGAAQNPVNAYGAAKARAELRHRYMPYNIVDIRIWNYFSHTQSTKTGFFMSDVVRAVETGQTLNTSGANMVRDYASPDDLHQLINKVLEAPPVNCQVDLYSKEEVSKFQLIDAITYKYNLITITDGCFGCDRYYPSLTPDECSARKIFGYEPAKTSLENVMHELNLRFGD